MERAGTTIWRRPFITFVVVCVGLLVLRSITARMPYPPGNPPWDCADYYRMSLDPLGRHSLPFGSRWLTPALAHVLPLEPEAAFELIDVVGYAIAATFLFELVSAQRAGFAASALAVGCFVTARYTAQWAFYLPIMVEALTHALLAAGLLCVQRKKDGALLLVLCLGALQKPWVLILIPYHFAHVLLRSPPPRNAVLRRLLPFVAYYGLPLGVFLCMHWRVAGIGSYTYAMTAAETLEVTLRYPVGVVRTLTAWMQTFGVALPVILADSKPAVAWLHRHLEWLVFVACCSVLFVTGGSNLEAFASYQWPLIAILFAVTVRERNDFWLRPGVIGALAVIHLILGGTLRDWGVGATYLNQWAYFAKFETVVSSILLHALAVLVLFAWRHSFGKANDPVGALPS